MVLFFAAWTVRATLLYAVDETIGSPILKAVYSNLLKLLIWVLPAMGFVAWLKGEKPAQYWALSSFPTRQQWKRCVIATAVFLLAVAAFGVTLGHKSVSLAALASTPLALSLLSLLVSPFLEEVLFRGFVLKELLSLSPLAVANPLTSLLFLGAHLPYWLSHGGVTPAMLSNCAGVFAFSLLAGWLFAKSRSIWPATLAHTANNTLAALLVAHGG